MLNDRRAAENSLKQGGTGLNGLAAHTGEGGELHLPIQVAEEEIHIRKAQGGAEER